MMRAGRVAAAMLAICIGFSGVAGAAERFPNGRKAALALTYDDSLESQLDNALPALDRHGFKATFYVTIGREGFPARLEDWRAAAANGHELGNHTLHHPCQGSRPGRDWVTPEADLDLYTVERIRMEAEMTNFVLQLVDGKESRTYAYPCGDVLAGGESYVDALAPMFVASRGVSTATDWIDRGEIDFARLATWGPTEVTGKELIAYAEEVLASGGIGTLTFHGIGGDYLSVSVEAHEELLDWLSAHQDEIWVDTVRAIATHLQSTEGE
ncbi:polysaccharide deacetylase family protein [Parvularcula marina]|uniref:Chitooligosaccharide deacetylase n=1 Tax=Parvularcula marina TaxID=2292771 RepID=A0A371RFS9_9PROT|nr:polysaccharide deacetylase family protein [Parvularcula marina]RFB04303.1 polysaccharide deacetylase [Parvularcula marina]